VCVHVKLNYHRDNLIGRVVTTVQSFELVSSNCFLLLDLGSECLFTRQVSAPNVLEIT